MMSRYARSRLPATWTARTSWSVTPAIAETTISRRCSGRAATIFATSRKHAASAKLVPPNLWTTHVGCSLIDRSLRIVQRRRSCGTLAGSEAKTSGADPLECLRVERHEGGSLSIVHEQCVGCRVRIESGTHQLLFLRLEGASRLDLTEKAYK